MDTRTVLQCTIPTDSDKLVEMYRDLGINYPKFFKMDRMSKAGFLAAEQVLEAVGMRDDTPKPYVSIVLVNSTSSTSDDIEFQKSIIPGNYYPSPSLFVYTLSNVVCAEIAIRNKILGETSFYVRKEFSVDFLKQAVDWAFLDNGIDYVLCGWIECLRGEHVCRMSLIQRI